MRHTFYRGNSWGIQTRDKLGDLVWLVWTGVKARSRGKGHLAFSFAKVLCSWLLFGESSIGTSWDVVRSSAGSLCWETWFGLLTDLNLKDQSGFLFVSFRDLKEKHSSLCSTVHIPLNWDPPCSKGIRFSYTGRGTVRRWICDPPRSGPQDSRIACHHFSTWKDVLFFLHLWKSWRDDSMPRAINFCFRWVWWEILLFWQFSCFPASFHFFNWAKPWGCCNLFQPWTKRTWTTNCDFSVHF